MIPNFPPVEGAIATVQVKGVQAVIDAITEENIVAYIDLTGYTVGDYEVDLKIENDDPRVTYIVTNKVPLKIVEK